ncbi:unnamed protein product [Prunus armeniaca]
MLCSAVPLFLAHDLSVIPDGETENDLREIWGSFLVARDLHYGLSKVGAEVYLPHCVVRQFGLIQTVSLFPLSTNRLSSWRANVSQSHGVAGISFQLQKGMTFLTLRMWKHRNAFDEDGRVWYEDFISARFIRPVEEATREALKNADWDPLPPKSGKGKEASTALSRPSAPAAVVSRVTTLPMAEVTVVASTATPSSRATTVVGARRTLAHRTVPSPPLVRPGPAASEYRFSRILSSIFLSFVANFVLSLEAPGRKRSREATITETAAAEAVLVGSAAAEVEVPEPPRKRVLLILSEGEDKEEVPPAVLFLHSAAVDVEVIATEAPVVEETIAEALGTEAADTEVAVGKGIVTEATTGEAAVAEATAGEAEARAVKMVVAEVPSAEAAAMEVPSAEAAAAESPLAALTGVAAVPSLAAMVQVGPPPVTPHRPSSIVIRSPPRVSLPLTVPVVSAAVAVTQEPLGEDDIAVVEPLATATPILTPTASVSMSMPQPPLSQESTVMTELAVTEISIVPPAAESLPPQMTSPNCTPAFTRRDVARFRTPYTRILGPLLNGSESSSSWESTK